MSQSVSEISNQQWACVKTFSKKKKKKKNKSYTSIGIKNLIFRPSFRRGPFWKFPNKSKVDLGDYLLTEFCASELGPVTIMAG